MSDRIVQIIADSGRIGPAVVIESPYAGATRRNRAYLRALIRAVALAGGTPYASHRMLPGALDDSDPEERAHGLALGRRMIQHLSPCLILFGVDYGWSPGMVQCREWLERAGVEWHEVTILERSA
jgi:hypothetical protein